MTRAFSIAPNQESRWRKIITRGIEPRTVQPTELPISKAAVSIIRRCDLFATPHQITF